MTKPLSFTTFSSAIKTGKEIFEQNIGFLQEQNRCINAAKGDWEVLTRSYSKGEYPNTPKMLRNAMNSEVDKYMAFRKARDKAQEVYDNLKAVIEFCSRPAISQTDYDTLTAQGYEVSWSKRAANAINEILPLLQHLLERVESIKTNINKSMPTAASHLNQALSYAYNHLGIATLADTAKNLTSKAYMDRAIAERKEELQKNTLSCLSTNPSSEVIINVPIKNETMKVDPENELQELCSLRGGLETLKTNDHVINPKDAEYADESKLLFWNGNGTSQYKTYMNGINKNEFYESKEDQIENKEVSTACKPPPPTTPPPSHWAKSKKSK